MSEKKKRYYRDVSPGVSGAIKDAAYAVADFVAPRRLKERDAVVDKDSGMSYTDRRRPERMRRREGQSTDSNNNY